jgi:fructan beta-fructosidase
MLFDTYGFTMSLRICGATVLALICVPAAALRGADDLVVADFEAETYGEWNVEGTAFGAGPARGTLANQMAVGGFEGERLVNSFTGGDRATGTLTSPPFTIERGYLNFLIGGGGYADETCINLLDDGRAVRTAVGPNTQSGGSETLEWAAWDVRDLQGQQARIQIVDRRTGGWGHINVDHIVQSDRSAAATPEDRRREIVLDQRYLLFPIQNGGQQCRLTITIDGGVVQNFDINLATGEPDWWSHFDLSAYAGKTAVLQVDRLPRNSTGLSRITVADAPRHTQPLYDEALRPQLRFSQQRGWNNDPNGMVYLDGEYHLFWQSNPFGPEWANMFWGHAVSRDLVHWKELPYALYPRTMAVDKCFSGSANVDFKNTGGWQTTDTPTLVAAFTDTGVGESLAVSRDRGRSWEYIPENPIIKHQGRDPKLIWYEPAQHWVIAVYTEIEQRQLVEFYTSRDLKRWELASQIDGFFECPEMVELPVDGDITNKRWVLFAANAEYVIGQFDGRTFTPEHTGKHKLHYGDYYASQCFSLAPEGRVIQIGWARIKMPGMPFNQAFSLPTELTLHSPPDGLRMRAQPIRELEQLRTTKLRTTDQQLTPEKILEVPFDVQLVEIEADIQLGSAKTLTLQFGENRIHYDVAKQQLDGMPLPLTEGRLQFRVVVDRPMYEICGGHGTVYTTAARSDPGKSLGVIGLSADGGDAAVRSLTLFALQSIWKK